MYIVIAAPQSPPEGDDLASVLRAVSKSLSGCGRLDSLYNPQNIGTSTTPHTRSVICMPTLPFQTRFQLVSRPSVIVQVRICFAEIMPRNTTTVFQYWVSEGVCRCSLFSTTAPWSTVLDLRRSLENIRWGSNLAFSCTF